EGDDADAKQDEADESTDTAAADGDEFAATDEQLEIGKKLYDGNCFACHAAGVAGAPKFGDAEAWKPYTDTGLETMLEVAIKGTGAMPPRGGSTASDEELEAAILYMISETK
ncbi:MAG TPA: c-type cytochrome, partial [Paenalcaligenes sp.]|nr:c-type cytochrome [Paenalcaligenes sp.]